MSPLNIINKNKKRKPIFKTIMLLFSSTLFSVSKRVLTNLFMKEIK